MKNDSTQKEQLKIPDKKKYLELQDTELEIVAGGSGMTDDGGRIESSISNNSKVERCFWNICVIK